MSQNFSGEFTRSLLEKIGGNSATLVLDSGGICVFASSAIENVLQLSLPDLQGRNFFDVIELRTLENKSVDRAQHPVVKALSHKDYIQATPFFCKLGTEEALALSTIQILSVEGKIDYVVVQIRKAKREVEVGEMKNLFLSFAAHQLKTPSSVVKGFLELMMRQGEAAYSKDQWHFLTSAFESNEQLIDVSKALLNLARLDGGLIEPNLREFDPYRALQGKIAAFSPLYQTKRVIVNFEATDETSQAQAGRRAEPRQLVSDEDFFLEIFGILLGNAIKHSTTGGEITVSCILRNANCEVHVIDNGPGISPEVQAKLFKEQQESGGEENAHGLGLYMAKKYIALLGGTIGLGQRENAALNSGSDFYFIVPNLPG